VFLLIIFFMTVSQVSEINKEQLELPKLEGSEDQKPTLITVNVTDTGELLVSGRRITVAGLVDAVGRELNRLGGDATRLTIVVRADERGQSRMVNEVVNALSRLGVKRIRIAVQSE
jgi:biopolymer transport protein ExbD